MYLSKQKTNTVINQFPYCIDFETGSLSPGWVVGDFDGIVSPDIVDLTQCKSNGNIALRYNTSGFWNNGSGRGADPEGTSEAIISPLIDLGNANSANVSFDYAYKQSWPSKPLELRIYAMQV